MTKRDFYLKVLESAIFIKHECKATHRETVFVWETTRDNETVWTGNVEVFDLSWHETARTCYAWVHISENESPKIFTLPRTLSIDSPQRAVQAAMFADAQQPLIPPASISLKLSDGGTSAAKSTATATVLAVAKTASNATLRGQSIHS